MLPAKSVMQDRKPRNCGRLQPSSPLSGGKSQEKWDKACGCGSTFVWLFDRTVASINSAIRPIPRDHSVVNRRYAESRSDQVIGTVRE